MTFLDTLTEEFVASFASYLQGVDLPEKMKRALVKDARGNFAHVVRRTAAVVVEKMTLDDEGYGGKDKGKFIWHEGYRAAVAELRKRREEMGL